jgi:hypothetical protein
MTRAGRQRACGVIVNEHPDTAREDYDTLKAIIHNCTRHGPASQNRDPVNDFYRRRDDRRRCRCERKQRSIGLPRDGQRGASHEVWSTW